MFVNIWLAISDAAQSAVLESLNWDEELQGPYTGPLRPRSRRLFQYMDDQTTRRRLFSKPTLQSITYNLWSIEFNEDERDTLQAVRDELDHLIAQYPNQIAVCGAWDWEGQQIGNPPIYPIPSYLWRFLPNPLPDGSTPTSNADLVDVNLLFGQSERDFS